VTRDREVGSDRDPVAVLQLEPEAGDERVGLRRTRVGSMLSTTSPSMISTERFSSAFFAYVCRPFLNIDRTASPASTTMIRALSCGMSG